MMKDVVGEDQRVEAAHLIGRPVALVRRNPNGITHYVYGTLEFLEFHSEDFLGQATISGKVFQIDESTSLENI